MIRFRALDVPPERQDIRRFGWSDQNPGPGFLVEFESRLSRSWIGDFAPGGWTGHSSVVPFPDHRRVLVLSSGIAYLVDPDEMTVDEELSDVAVEAYLAPAPGLLILNWHGIEFEGYDAKGFRWSTRRVSWDGIQNVRISGNELTADTWSAPYQTWIPVTVDLVTGKATGGAYPDGDDGFDDEQLYSPE
jgi:hypothetical protein